MTNLNEMHSILIATIQDIQKTLDAYYLGKEIIIPHGRHAGRKGIIDEVSFDSFSLNDKRCWIYANIMRVDRLGFIGDNGDKYTDYRESFAITIDDSLFGN